MDVDVMSIPAHAYTTYEELAQQYPEGTLCDLIDGEVYMTPAPTTRHQMAVATILVAFKNAITDRSVVLIAPTDVVLGPHAAPQPDVVFVSEANRAIVQEQVRGVPDLVVEVLSPSTADRDKGIKFRQYERHGVGELWIVSLENQTIEVYRLDAMTKAYRIAVTFRPGDKATTPIIPRLQLNVADVFAP